MTSVDGGAGAEGSGAEGSGAEAVTIRKDEAAGRYEILLGGRRVGLADFYQRGDVVVIPHTETLPEFGGRGLAGRLVRYCLDDLRAQGLRVEPACPFVAAFIRKNPEYADLVAPA